MPVCDLRFLASSVICTAKHPSGSHRADPGEVCGQCTDAHVVAAVRGAAANEFLAARFGFKIVPCASKVICQPRRKIS
jgi:hypothetical protein